LGFRLEEADGESVGSAVLMLERSGAAGEAVCMREAVCRYGCAPVVGVGSLEVVIVALRGQNLSLR